MSQKKREPKKRTKVDFRIDAADKDRMHRFAAASNYREREFSVWARRILLGEEQHPKFK